jgi:hypothetical protein
MEPTVIFDFDGDSVFKAWHWNFKRFSEIQLHLKLIRNTIWYASEPIEFNIFVKLIGSRF